MSSVVKLILTFSEARQFHQVVLQSLGFVFLHIDLFGVPVAKLAEVDGLSGFGIFCEGEYAVAIGTREAKGAFAVLIGRLGNAFAGPAEVGSELRDCAVVATIG